MKSWIPVKSRSIRILDGILDGLKNQDLEQVAASLGNVLEKVTVEAYPVIAQIKEITEDNAHLVSNLHANLGGLYRMNGQAEACKRTHGKGYLPA